MKQFLIAILLFHFNITAFSQNVGIGTTTPGFPLNFATTTGDKISLYGNSGSHYGFGIQGGLLQKTIALPNAIGDGIYFIKLQLPNTQVVTQKVVIKKP